MLRRSSFRESQLRAVSPGLLYSSFFPRQFTNLRPQRPFSGPSNDRVQKALHNRATPSDALKFVDQHNRKPFSKTCNNGVRLVIDSQPGTGLASVGVWTSFGSSTTGNLEDEGLVHFFEHMIFKGTEKWSKKKLETWVERIGAQLNAYTTRHSVGYYAECLSRDARDVLSLILELVFKAKLDSKDVMSEKLTVLREAQEVNLIPEEVLLDAVHRHVYDESDAKGQTILGSDQAIRGVTRHKLVDIQKRLYRTQNLIVVVSGDAKVDEIVKLVESIPPSSSPEPKPIQRPSKPRKGVTLFVQESPEPLGTLHIARTLPIPGRSTEEFIWVLVSRIVLSKDANGDSDSPAEFAGLHARVPTYLPTARQLNHDVMFDSFSPPEGLVGCYRSVPIPSWLVDSTESVTQRMVPWVESIGEEMRQELLSRLAKVTPESLEAAKEDIRITFMGTTDSCCSKAEELARQTLVDGGASSIEDLNHALSKIRFEDITRFIEEKVVGIQNGAALTALYRFGRI